MTMTTAYALSMLCMAVVVVIVLTRMRRIERLHAIMHYLSFEELRLRACGADDTHIAKAWEHDWKPMDELQRTKSGKLMWFRDEEGHLALAFTDGKEIWWTDDKLDPVEWALINDGDQKISIRVEFEDEDSDEDTAEDGKITIGGEVPLDTAKDVVASADKE